MRRLLCLLFAGCTTTDGAMPIKNDTMFCVLAVCNRVDLGVNVEEPKAKPIPK